MPISMDAIADFVSNTLPKKVKRRWVDISMPYQEYISAKVITEKNVTEMESYQIDYQVQTTNQNLAHFTGPYAQDQTGVTDIMTTASVPWAFQTTNWSFDLLEEAMQGDETTIIKLLVTRDHTAHNDMATLNERALFSAPTGSTDKVAMGIPFWIVKDATATTGSAAAGSGGFTTSCPTGWTKIANIDPATTTGWRNYAFKYTQPTTDDLVKGIKKAMFFTNFQPPVPYPELGFGKTDRDILTTYRVVEPLERLAETRNDNLGNDLAKYVGTVVVGGVGVRAVPYLEYNDTTDPVYGVNWGTIRPFSKKGLNMVRRPPFQPPNQHTVRIIHIDNSMQFVAYNRRLLWVGSTS